MGIPGHPRAKRNLLREHGNNNGISPGFETKFLKVAERNEVPTFISLDDRNASAPPPPPLPPFPPPPSPVSACFDSGRYSPALLDRVSSDQWVQHGVHAFRHVFNQHTVAIRNRSLDGVQVSANETAIKNDHHDEELIHPHKAGEHHRKTPQGTRGDDPWSSANALLPHKKAQKM